MKIPKPKKYNFEPDKYGNKVISTTIPIEMYRLIKSKGMSFKELIIRGYQATTGFNNVLERLKELEEGNAKLNLKLGEIWRQNATMRHELEKYQQNGGNNENL